MDRTTLEKELGETCLQSATGTNCKAFSLPDQTLVIVAYCEKIYRATESSSRGSDKGGSQLIATTHGFSRLEDIAYSLNVTTRRREQNPDVPPWMVVAKGFENYYLKTMGEKPGNWMMSEIKVGGEVMVRLVRKTWLVEAELVKRKQARARRHD